MRREKRRVASNATLEPLDKRLTRNRKWLRIQEEGKREFRLWEEGGFL